jgi:hypothetical protein
VSEKSQATTPMTVSPEIGQYSYADFEEVLKWIRHFTNAYGPTRLGVDFDRYCRIRSYYLEREDPQLEVAGVIEDVIKNDVGVRRLSEERPEYFTEPNVRRGVNFYQGRFLGWDDELVYDPTLKAVCCYVI